MSSLSSKGLVTATLATVLAGTVIYATIKLIQSRKKLAELYLKYKGIEKKSCPSMTFDEALRLSSSSSSKDDNVVIVDTRTPKEFIEAHVIRAVNVPIMSDYQRHVVGTTYHKKSRQAAIRQGKAFFAPAIYDFLNQFEQYRNKKKILVYCWRGGMRSRIVVNLLNMNGYDAIQIQGGYKVYMKEIVWKGLESFGKSYPPKFIVLFGNTGTRKTEILHRLKQQHCNPADNGAPLLPVLDLEGLASHKGSLFGGVDMAKRSQKMFSILLYHELESLKDCKYIFVEGEANKIGNIHVPEFVYKKITQDVALLIQASLQTRITSIRKDYFATSDSIQQLHEAGRSPILIQHIGHKKLDALHKRLDDGDYDGCIEWFLLNYYDTRYRFAKKGYSYALEISSDDIDECCNKLVEFYHSLLQNDGTGATTTDKAAKNATNDNNSVNGA